MAGPGFAVANASVVATLAAAVSIGAWRAMLRTGNSSITLVALAFAILAAKNAAKAVLLVQLTAVPTALEALFGLADVAMVGLIAWPLLARRPEGTR